MDKTDRNHALNSLVPANTALREIVCSKPLIQGIRGVMLTGLKRISPATLLPLDPNYIGSLFLHCLLFRLQFFYDIFPQVALENLAGGT